MSELSLKSASEIKQKNEKVDQSSIIHPGKLRGDCRNISILLFLYFLQGIPLGISMAIPILLQNRKVTYSEQAIFTIAFYPFTCKILWAPLVDSVYVKSFGRRKSWLIPSQILIGIFMLFLAQHVDEWMGNGDENKPQMILLTTVFFILWLLTATQDIAVDGWALKMLDRRNVGHAATCNIVGQAAGGFVGYVLLLLLESKNFANQYIFSEPRNEGLVTLSGFLKFWGCIFLVATVLVGIFKSESSEDEKELESHPDFGALRAYKLLWKIIRLKSIQNFSVIVLTVGLSFAAADSMTNLKLVEYGIPRDKIALLTIPLVPINIVLPIILSKFTTGPYPLNLYIRAFPCRLAMSAVIASFLYLTPTIINYQADKSEGIPFYYYSVLVILYMVEQIPAFMMHIALLAFVAKISDPLIGSTYMTLLTTLINFGFRWSSTLSLWLVDKITWKSCNVEHGSVLISTAIEAVNNKCSNQNSTDVCTKTFGGECSIEVDGFYIEVLINTIYGVFWWFWARKMIDRIQNISADDWHILSRKEIQYDESIVDDKSVSVCYI